MSREPPGKSGASAGVKQQDLLLENKTSIRDFTSFTTSINFLYVSLACSSLMKKIKQKFLQQE